MSEDVWGDSVARDSTSPGDVKIRLRWTERDRRAVAGIWQVTTLKVPAADVASSNPPGLCAHGDIVLGDSDEFQISFTPPNSLASSLGIPSPSRNLRTGRRTTVGAARANANPRQGLGVAANALKAIKGKPTRFYVRVIGVDSSGNRACLPSNSIEIVYEPSKMSTLVIKPPPTEQEQKEEYLRRLSSQPVRAEIQAFTPSREAHPEWRYHWVVTRSNPLGWPVGKKLHFKRKSKSWLDDVSDAVGDAVEAVKDATDWVSGAWSDLKGAVVEAVVSAIPECGPDCRKAVAVGVEAGLTAAGLPPSLPDFDAMTDVAKGYIVETIAAEAMARTGVPAEGAEIVAKRFVAAVSDRAKSGGGAGWMRLDPDFRERPARAFVKVWSQSREVAQGYTLCVDFTALYRPVSVPLPPLRPGASFVLPVALTTADNDYWRREIADERHRQKSKRLISYLEVSYRWREEHDTRPHTLSVGIHGAPGTQLYGCQNSFVAKDGYSR